MLLLWRRACAAVKGCASLSQCDADINQTHLTCCLTYCSRWHVFVRGRSCAFLSALYISQDCHQPFMFFSFACVAAHCSMPVTQPFVMAYYFRDVILHWHKCKATYCSKLGFSIETCQNARQTKATKLFCKRFIAFKKRHWKLNLSHFVDSVYRETGRSGWQMLLFFCFVLFICFCVSTRCCLLHKNSQVDGC